MRRDVLHIVGVEPIVDFAEQLGSGLQVDLSRTDIYMSHIGSKGRKPGVDILSVSIPGQQPMNGKGVTCVMDARAVVFAFSDAALCKQALERLMDRGVTEPPTTLVKQQWRVRRARFSLQPSVEVLVQCLGGRAAQRDPASLAELAFGDIEPLLIHVEVFHVQREGFPDPYAGAIEKTQQRVERVRSQGSRGRQIRGGCQQCPDFVQAVDIWLMSPMRRGRPQWLGYIAERIGSGQVFTELADHTEAVALGARRKHRKRLLIPIGDLAGEAWLAQLLLDQETVEIPQQESLRSVVSA